MMDTDAYVNDMRGKKKSKPKVIFRASKERKTLANTGMLNNYSSSQNGLWVNSEK